MQKFRLGMWDGFIRLFKRQGNLLYAGLFPYLEGFCRDRGYELIDETGRGEYPISRNEVIDYFKSLDLPDKIKQAEDQIDAITHCLRKSRCVLLSPTGSGKSLSIYAITRFYDKRTLIIVPSTALVLQMRDDFAFYSSKNGWDVDGNISIIMGGYEKENLKQVVISTWQSISKLPAAWFSDYEAVIVDEAHGAKGKEIQSIMEKMPNCYVRLGFTGTLDDVKVHKYILEGLFGIAHRVVDTATLIEQGRLSEITIRCLVLQHNRKMVKALHGDYQEEIDYLVNHDKRNRFIANLAASLPGNTLVLFNRIAHGKRLVELLEKKASEDTTIYFISGEVDAEERSEIRKAVDSPNQKTVTVASQGTTAVGTNIVHINNLIFAHPTKSKIRNLQSIGRALRRNDEEGKSSFTLFDIADDLRKSKSHVNHTLRHFKERLRIYMEERFKPKINNIQLEKD